MVVEIVSCYVRITSHRISRTVPDNRPYSRAKRRTGTHQSASDPVLQRRLRKPKGAIEDDCSVSTAQSSAYCPVTGRPQYILKRLPRSGRHDGWLNCQKLGEHPIVHIPPTAAAPPVIQAQAPNPSVPAVQAATAGAVGAASPMLQAATHPALPSDQKLFHVFTTVPPKLLRPPPMPPSKLVNEPPKHSMQGGGCGPPTPNAGQRPTW